MPAPKQRQATPPPFIVIPEGSHTHSFILLHGLGSNGEKFGTELLETGKTSEGQHLPDIFPGAKFIFPTSRWRRSTAFGRSMLTAWFDSAHLDYPSHRKELQIQGLSESVREVMGLLCHERDVCHIPPGRIVLGGISQGCATSLSTLLCLDHAVGGFVGMSGYLPFREDIDEAVKEELLDEDDPFASEDTQDEHEPSVKATEFERDLLDLAPLENASSSHTAQSTPVFLGHGSADEKVPCSLGLAMAETMRRAGYRVTWNRYEGLGHWYKIPDEIDDIVAFLQSSLK